MPFNPKATHDPDSLNITTTIITIRITTTITTFKELSLLITISITTTKKAL